MFKKYGFVGIILIIFAQVNFFLKIEPFQSWYVPIIWWGYILTVDAIVFKIKGESLISNKFKQFIGIVALSVPIWAVFEFYNIFIQNWHYINFSLIVHLVNFTIILPAVLETYQLLKSTHLFDKIKLKKKHNISKRLITIMITLGIFSLVLPFIFPKYTFPLVWLSFFLLLDPINYLNKRPSIISHLKDKKLIIPLSLFFGAIICGFFWEFWNFWAFPKWFYTIPFLGSFKIFEMPILGYIGYGPFGWQLYAMYNFLVGIFSKKTKID
jgi:hypothetical protein